MSWFKNSVIGKYFGVNQEKQFIGKQLVNMESDAFSMDSFSIGSSVSNFYNENTKFVELTEKNFILNDVISQIGKRFSNVNFVSSIENALLKKLNNPNKSQSKEEFLKEFAKFILAAGWTIIWKKYESFGNFDSLELVNINPDTANPENDNISFIHHKEAVTVKLSDVILFYDSARINKTKKGYSRATPLKSQLQNISLAQKAKNIQIQNSGTTIVSPKQVSAGNSIDEGLNAPVPVLGTNLKTQKEEMEDRLNNRGLENRIIVSSKGVDAVNLSEKLNKIDFHKIIEPDAKVVCSTYNYPEELSPYGQTAKFDNKDLAELSLYENEVIPLANNFINSLSSEFSNKGTVEISYSHVGCMSIVATRVIDKNQKIINQFGYLLEKNIIKENEFKDILIQNKILDGPK